MAYLVILKILSSMQVGLKSGIPPRFWSHGEFQPRVYEWHDTHRVLAESKANLLQKCLILAKNGIFLR